MIYCTTRKEGMVFTLVDLCLLFARDCDHLLYISDTGGQRKTGNTIEKRYFAVKSMVRKCPWQPEYVPSSSSLPVKVPVPVCNLTLTIESGLKGNPVNRAPGAAIPGQ
jgi:hypothetical protein